MSLALPEEQMYEILAASSEEQLADWAKAYWKRWLLEPEQNEERMRAYLFGISGGAREAAHRGDSRTIQQFLYVYDYGYTFCREEPFLSSYEFGLMQINIMLASLHLTAGRFDSCLRDVAAIEKCLQEGDKRRARLHIPARPTSEIRLHCLGLRASCLIENPSTLRRGQAIELARQFWSIADALEARLATRPEHVRETVLQGTARAEIEICKLASLSSNSRDFAEAVDRFNKRYAADLSTEPLLEAPWDSELKTAWHWDLEVYKHLRNGTHLSEAFIYCINQREASFRLTYGAQGDELMKKLWRRSSRVA